MLNSNTVAQVEFEIIREIGQEGRNSKVFVSYDPALDAELVIKRVDKSSVTDTQQLFNEARVLYKSSHPNVVPINYACQDNNFIYLAMPFFRNGSLSKFMELRHLTVREIIRYTCQFLSGLHNIHSKGLIHFDIKPDNILLSDQNEACLSDFGLTKYMNGIGLATPNQMYVKQVPIECFRHSEYSIAFDIYQAGLTIYRMCVGNTAFNEQFFSFVSETAFDRERFETALENEIFPNRNAYPEHIPDKLKSVIDQCLKANADDRYTSAINIINELSDIDENLFDWQYEYEDGQKKWTKSTDGRLKSIVVIEGNAIATQTSASGRTSRINEYCVDNIGMRRLKSFFKRH